MPALILNKKGMSIIFAVFTLLLLSVLGVALFSMISSDVESAASRVVLSRAIGTAEGGIQIGTQAIIDDVNAAVQTGSPTDNGYHGVVYLEGYSYSGSGYISSRPPRRACLHGRRWNNQNAYFCRLQAITGANVTIWDFKQKRNLIGTRLKALEIVMRARTNGGSGLYPVIQLEYSIDGGLNWIQPGDPLTNTFTIDNSSWTSGDTTLSYRSVPFDALVDWNTFMNQSANFMIRARRITDPSEDPNTGRRCDIDWLALRATVEVDAQTEEWFSDWMNGGGTPTPKTVDMALGNGKIRSIAISDESGKININYVTADAWRHLRYLMIYNGIPSGTAGTLTNLVIARISGGDWFDTIEELKQITGMTDEYYDMIDQDVTVYSWVNNATTRSGTPTNPQSRAPVNINTASKNVLKAILRYGTRNNSRAERLANEIITRRTTQPFTHMYSTYAHQAATRDLKSFSGFIESRTYLNNNRKRRICEYADATFYNRDVTRDWNSSRQRATEFSYYSNTFLITAVGESGDISRTVASAFGNSYDYATYSLSTDGTFNLPTYIGDATLASYWRERR